MCNITNKTKRQTVTVYKVVIKLEGKYYAAMSGVKIKIGVVKPQTNRDYEKLYKPSRGGVWRYNKACYHYSKNMVGKSSGFAELMDAKRLWSDYSGFIPCSILKIVLGGEIWEGDAMNISNSVRKSAVIYAGTEILSFEEIL